MKSKMVQELLLKALINRLNQARPAAKAANGAHLPGNTPNTQSELAKTLLKSLYLNNSPNQNISNIKKTNEQQKETAPETKAAQGQGIDLAIEKINKENPEFFKDRSTLLDYLKSVIKEADDEDLAQIVKITKELEEAAIKRFCAKNPKFAQFLEGENQKALNKLQGMGANEMGSELSPRRTFSQSDIEKMSDEEFLRHQSDIDAQLTELLRAH